MVIYEVTAVVDAELVEAYEQFMIEQHIPDLLMTHCFKSASIELSEPGRYRIRYSAETRDALDRYLENDAPRLRRDFVAHFPEGVEVSREEWIVLRSFA